MKCDNIFFVSLMSNLLWTSVSVVVSTDTSHFLPLDLHLLPKRLGLYSDTPIAGKLGFLVDLLAHFLRLFTLVT